MDKPSYTFKQLAAEVLRDALSPLTAEEIWTDAERRGLHRQLRSVGQTPTATLYADLHRATQDGTDSDFVRVGSRPRRYWLKTRAAQGELVRASPSAVEGGAVPAPGTHCGAT